MVGYSNTATQHFCNRMSNTCVLPGNSPVSDSPFGSDELEDNMSEASSDSHIIVTHPDEEDSAERRWRLAEQRGNDIRRAQSVPSPRVQGTSSYLKVMVVCQSSPASWQVCVTITHDARNVMSMKLPESMSVFRPLHLQLLCCCVSAMSLVKPPGQLQWIC